jgi:predicted nucleotidyltransferase component of viral defense system
MSASFLHQLPDAQQLFEVVGQEKNVLPLLVEKDYWLMHSLWGLKLQGFNFELKGGTSLSKGFGIINRFSEDIDIHIHPDATNDVKTGKNHDKESHIQSRRSFFDRLSEKISIPDLVFERDSSFDDKEKMRNAGITAKYSSFFSSLPDIKPAVLSEVGFDQTTPHLLTTITSWAYEKASALNFDIIDNRAIDIKCYCPEYTFVEKLSAISCKFRNQQQMETFPVNFLRHYYDVYQLLAHDSVLNFIGTETYYEHKEKRFRSSDEKSLKKNDAFIFPNEEVKALYREKYQEKASLYYEEQPPFDKILDRILIYIDKL